MSKKIYCLMIALVMLLAVSCVSAAEDADNATLTDDDAVSEDIVQTPSDDVSDEVLAEGDDDPGLDIEEVEVDEYGDVCVDVTIDDEATGNVSYTISSQSGDLIASGSEEIEYGECLIEYEEGSLSKGTYTVVVTYPGDDTYTSAEATATFTINKDYPDFNVVVYVDEYGLVWANATLPLNATGTVTFEVYSKDEVDEGEEIKSDDSDISNGTAYAVFVIDEQGTFTVYALYDGDDNYYAADVSDIEFEITKDLPDVDCECSVDDGIITAEVTIDDDATGNITVILVNSETSETYTSTKEIDDGSCDFEFTVTSKGWWNVTVSYPGDDSYYAENLETGIEISKDDPDMTLDVEVNDYGIPVVQVSLDDDATGTVTFIFSGPRGESFNKTDDVTEGSALYYDSYDFSAGEWNITAVYSGDNNFSSDEITESFEIDKGYPDIEITSILNNNQYVTVKGSVNGATGNVTVSFLTGELLRYKYTDITLDDGNFEFTTTDQLDIGDYTVLVSYLGDDDYYLGDANGTVSIRKTATMEVNASVNNYGMIIIDAKLDEDATGNVTFIITNSTGSEVANLTVDVDNGTASFSELMQFDKDTYQITVKYSGDENYGSLEYGCSADVTKSVPSVSDNVDVNEGNVTITVAMPSDATGNITYYVNSEGNYTAAIENGTVTIKDIYTPGNYTVQILWDGDDNYYGIYEYFIDFTVKYTPSVNHTVSVDHGYVTVTLSLPADATGNVTYYINSTYNITSQIANGTVQFADTYKSGNYQAVISWAGDDKYYGLNNYTVSFDVLSNVVITAGDVSAVYNKNAAVAVTVVNNETNAPVAAADLVLTLNGKTYKASTNANGVATFSIPASMIPKAYTFKVTYAGNTTYYDGSSAEYKFTVTKAKPKITAKKKTFKKAKKVKKYKVTLKDNNKKAIKKAKLTLKIKGKKYTAKTNKKGKAVFKIKKLTKKGKYTGKVTFKGNKYFTKLTKKAKITIK